MSAAELLFEARCELIRRASQPAVIERSGAFCRQQGLDFVEVEAACGFTAILPVAFDSGRFAFAEDGDGEAAVVIEVFDENAETIDLAAWPVGAPDRVRTMFGIALALGVAAARNPATYALGRPLRVMKSGLDWLRAGGIGCVILDPVEGVRLLRDVGERGHRIAAADVTDAIKLRDQIERLFPAECIVCATPHRNAA